MKSVKDYIEEIQEKYNYNPGSAFKDEDSHYGLSDWKRWEKENKNKFNIIFDEHMQCYFIYTKGDKPGYIMQHVGTYNALDGIFYYDKGGEIKDLYPKK